MNAVKIELLFPGGDAALQQYLREDIGIPKGLLHEIRMLKSVKVNGEAPNWTTPLQAGDQISISIPKEEEIGVKPAKMEIPVLFEDDHLLIVDKKAGIDTHPTSESDLHSLSNGVAYYFMQQHIPAKVRHIHRLDKDTSGAILFAKHALSAALLDRQLEARKIKRTYLALVEGLVFPTSGTIRKAIGKDRHHAARRRISPGGQRAVTHYQVIKKFTQEKLSLIELTLETGRTHQIRVHMSSLGYPLAGDVLYGAKKEGFSRQSLHAWKLAVPHPFSNSLIQVTAAIPANFAPSHLLPGINKAADSFHRSD